MILDLTEKELNDLEENVRADMNIESETGNGTPLCTCHFCGAWDYYRDCRGSVHHKPGCSGQTILAKILEAS